MEDIDDLEMEKEKLLLKQSKLSKENFLKIIDKKKGELSLYISMCLWFLSIISSIVYYDKKNNYFTSEIVFIIISINCIVPFVFLILSTIVSDICLELADEEYKFAKKMVNIYKNREKFLIEKMERKTFLKEMIEHSQHIKETREYFGMIEK